MARLDLRVLTSEVSSLLWQSWDPIGVNDDPLTRNEYASYAPGCIKLAVAGDAAALAEHLRQVRADAMGLDGPLDACDRETAKALVRAAAKYPGLSRYA